MIHGENLILAINGTPLAASKSCSLSKSSSFIEVASPTDGSWESFVPAKKGWSMSSDCLLATMDAYKTLDAAWKAGTALTIRFFNTEYNENETGTAYIDKLDLQASKGNLAKMSVSLKGSGPLTEYTGENIQVNTSVSQQFKFYAGAQLGAYILTDSIDGRVFSGSFTIPKRTLVQITTNGNTVLLSNSNTITRKAANGDLITMLDYRHQVLSDTRIWLDARTWYLIETNSEYTTASIFKSISV